MTADCIRHAVLDTYCEIYFSFSFSAENGRSFSFSFIFRPKKENLFFGYFYFTAEKVKFIFGRPLNWQQNPATFQPVYRKHRRMVERVVAADLLEELLGLLDRRCVCGDDFFFCSRRWNGTFAAAANKQCALLRRAFNTFHVLDYLFSQSINQ